MKASLHLYRHARLIVQRASTSAADAALAMQTNEIGCVLVSAGSAIVGIVTDRDLALRVVGAARDPRATRLLEIMSSPVALLDVNAPHEAALRLMRERNVRRVPLVEGARVVGMVTFDDLLLERTATLDELVGIVRAQMIEGGPARTRRFDEWRALERRHARALTTWTRLVARLQATTELERPDRAEAERAIELVLGSIVRRLDRTSANKLIARLPTMVRARLQALPPGPDLSVTRASVEREMAEALDVDDASASVMVNAVGAVLGGTIDASDRVARRLPPDLRSFLRSRKVQRGSRVPLVRRRGARRGAPA